VSSPVFDKHLLAKMISGVETGFTWDSFHAEECGQVVSFSQVEEVAPLLYWQLAKSEKLQYLPKAGSDILRATYYSTRMQNEQNICELDRLIGLFHQAGIRVAALKGISLVLTIYPDIGLRQMADVDLLVPASRISAAVQLVKSYGYADTEVEPEAIPGLIQLFAGEVSLKKIEMPFTMLELHNSLLADTSFTYAVPVEWFWEQTKPVSHSQVGENLEQLYILSPEAQLLYLAAHAMLKHGSRSAPLRWFYDLDLLVRFYSADINWDLILRQARLFQWSSSLYAALAQTHDYFNTRVPEQVLSTLSESRDRHGELILAKGNVPSTRVLEERQGLMERKWFGKIIVIFGLLFPSPAYMRWRYGLKSFWNLPVWYLYRWWSIVKDTSKTFMDLNIKQLSRTLKKERANNNPE
jgi:hypothetical protein